MTAWLAFCSCAVYAVVPDANSLVQIRKATETSNGLVGGFVVDKDGHILTSMKDTQELLYVHLADGTVIYAEMIKHDKTTNLALIKPNAAVINKVPSPYVFAKQPAKTQRQVSAFNLALPLNKSTLVKGTLAKISSGTAQQPTYYQHNALTSRSGVGTPLFNNCGEVVGVISAKARPLFNRTKEKGAVAHAVASEWVIEKITDNNSIERAVSGCLSIVAQAEANKKAAEEKVKAEKTAREAAQKEALKKEEKILQERDAAQKEAREKEEKIQSESTARAKAEAEAKKADAKKTQYREYIKWGIGGGAILFALLLLFMGLKRRARLQAKAATEKAQVAHSDLAAMQDRDARIAATPEVFIEGGTSSERFALRIPPAEIAKEGGVIIGRNPQNCDFVINHPQVSRQQFNLTYENDALIICDLNSSNGTSVDGRKLTGGESAMLADNSRIEINQLNFIVQTSTE